MRKQDFRVGYGTVHVRHLDGMSEAIQYMENAEAQQRASGMSGASLDESRTEWYGTKTMQEAIELARFGWEEGRRKLLRQVGRVVVDELVGRRFVMDPVLDYSGDEVDIDNFLLGRPDHMIEYPLRYDASGKQATAFMNCSVSHRVSAERIMQRGAAVLVAIEALRAEGYSLGLTMTQAVSEDNTMVEYHVPVIHPGDFLDIDTVAFCTAHPSFLRRLIFSLNEHESTELRRRMGFYAGGRYGIPTEVGSELPPHSFVIKQGEGLDLYGDATVQQFVQNVVDRAIAALES